MLVLAALFVGILIPVLISLASLMRKAEKTLGRFDKEMIAVLSRTGEVLDRIDGLGETLQEGLPHLNRSMERIEKFSESLEGLRKNIKTASVLGAAAAPVIAGAVQAIRAATAAKSCAEDSGADHPEEVVDFTGALSPDDLKPEDFIPEHLRQKEKENE